MRAFKSSIFLSVLFCLFSTSLLADNCAPPPKAAGPITTVSAAKGPGQEETDKKIVALGSWVAVKGDDVDVLQREAKCSNKKIVVYLNGRVAAGLVAEAHSNHPKTLYFRLSRTAEARAVWDEILSAPDFNDRDLDVTVGIEGQPPLPGPQAGLKLKPLDGWSFGIALIGFIGLLGLFFSLAMKTNVLRDSLPSDDAVPVIAGRLDPSRSAGNHGTYSLSRLQGAWWLFIILGAYLLIGIVTWDFYTSLSSTALILLGLSAGTVVGGAIIDASKATPEQKAAEASKAAELRRQIEQLADAEEYATLEAKRLDELFGPKTLSVEDIARYNALIAHYGDIDKWLRSAGGLFADIANIFELVALGRPAAGSPQDARKKELNAKLPNKLNDLCELAVLIGLKPAPGTQDEADMNALKAKVGGQPKPFLDLVPKHSDVKAQCTLAISRYRKLTGQSEAWFTDILSDANGVSLHRFQLFAWTAILGIIFIGASYRNLAMPVFDTTLMGLLGLSAGTYLGLKIPEATVPK
ncbi:hypothetical protein [Bradyrhizobium iriomotense]|uniref:hypothetical protein n=1 Tax=Bradyrhizobium iriomotense TaxID=441950 RepID=UPI001B8A7FC5|nr:hypothetical protein [Bradyrhizobium iriomotense]MBR1128930.1 hypothetical protein [Bradyrhizobium iriomotense]